MDRVIRHFALWYVQRSTFISGGAGRFGLTDINLSRKAQDTQDVVDKHFPWCRYHGPRPAGRENAVWVCNHTSMIDYIILTAYSPFAVIMQLHPGWVRSLTCTPAATTCRRDSNSGVAALFVLHGCC